MEFSVNMCGDQKKVVAAGYQPLMVVEHQLFYDHRGWFSEVYRHEGLHDKLHTKYPFVQDNMSFSYAGVFRGLHFQWGPPMGKLVSCVKGCIIDIVIDIRASSPCFGEVYSLRMSGDDCFMFWVPFGFAHGFIAIEDSIVSYKCDNEYGGKENEFGIIMTEKEFNSAINSYINLIGDISYDNLIVSEKDKNAPTLEQLKTLGVYEKVYDDMQKVVEDERSKCV